MEHGIASAQGRAACSRSFFKRRGGASALGEDAGWLGRSLIRGGILRRGGTEGLRRSGPETGGFGCLPVPRKDAESGGGTSAVRREEVGRVCPAAAAERACTLLLRAGCLEAGQRSGEKCVRD